MGFRSTFVTLDYPMEWPNWFKDKYAGRIHFSEDRGHGGISSVRQEKNYFGWADLAEDIQKAVDWSTTPWSWGKAFIFVFLHECGGLTRVHITKDLIRYSEPECWPETGEVTHHYCRGCADLPGD